MQYNTSKDKLVIREYGRNVQELIRYACTIEDRNERQRVANYIIEAMIQINPNNKGIEDYRRKLWDHLFIISNFELDVDSPYPKPDPTVLEYASKSIKIPYPKQRIRFRHYGRYVEGMIKKALETEDPEKKAAFAAVIGNYMKLVGQQWNRENITDETIKGDFKMMTAGDLELPDETNLDSLARSTRNVPKQDMPLKKRPTGRGKKPRQSGSYQKPFNKRKKR
jgi:hypothetical protein